MKEGSLTVNMVWVVGFRVSGAGFKVIRVELKGHVI